GLGALGAPGAQEAESTLLEALGSQNEGLARAAAEALGKIGTVRAVLPLKETEAAVPNDRAFQRAARHAVAEIQARLTGASAGPRPGQARRNLRSVGPHLVDPDRALRA